MTEKRTTKSGKYHKWITNEGLTILEGWARDGLTNEQISKNIGINPDTLYKWFKRFPEIDDALKRGKEVVDTEVENAMLKSALGYEYEEVKTHIEDTQNGQRKRVEKTTKHVPPNTTAQIFWLKNRRPELWRDKQDVEHGGKVDFEDVSPKDKLKEKLKGMQGKQGGDEEGE